MRQSGGAPVGAREPRGESSVELEELRSELHLLRRLQDETQRELLAARGAVAARDYFIAAAGHELRNPMSAVVLLISHMAFRARQAPEMPDWFLTRLTSLDRQTKRFVRRATTLLDVSRLTTGRMRLERELVTLDDVVREVGTDLAAEAESAGCRLELALDPEVSGQWDRTAVEQIAGSLLSNAIKYGAGQPVGVLVRGDTAIASLSIRDRGIGITNEDRDRIFQPFERAVSQAERPGFGVGLWIARQLAVAHGGDIAVESRPGAGSIFTATLPRGNHEPHP
jgi:signal transduction histidine kinase